LAAEYAAVNNVLYFVFGFSINDDGFGQGKSLARHRVSIGRLEERDMEYQVDIYGSR
jgi:hypothetical protein